MELTKLQIIEETVEYYSTHSRSVEGGTVLCRYNDEHGNKCAFSRCCTDDSVFSEGESSCDQKDAILLPQYAHIPYTDLFWKSLQGVHDKDWYWDGNNLTEEGKENVTFLKNKYP